MKIFNTPDFDPVTGIYGSELPQGVGEFEVKSIDHREELKLSVFPNPSIGNEINLRLSLPVELNSLVEIRGVNGGVVYQKEFQNIKEMSTLTFPEALSSGVYVLQLKNSQILLTKRFIVR
ncbi:MAG: T9SS type A sorting domain-containing protein [Flavobacteriales bacterium]|nr:T9SS type A sorting domain-containing protein [Flavobacteriales bacterium]